MKENIMNDPRKAGSLILNNLGMLNEASLLLEVQIEVEVFRNIQEEIEAWLDESGWHGQGEWDSEYMWVSPATWKLDNDNDNDNDLCKAVFEFDFEKKEPEGSGDSYSLAYFCGYGQVRVGFRFTPKFEYFGKKKEWTNFCNKSLPAAASGLQKLGFVYDKGHWFLPVTLSNADLAVAYEGEDYAEALQPVRRALDQLKKVQPVFDEIIRAAELALNIKDTTPR